MEYSESKSQTIDASESPASATDDAPVSPPVAVASDGVNPTGSFVRALASPLWIWSPKRATDGLLACSRAAFGVSFLMWGLLLGAVLVLLFMWDASIEQDVDNYRNIVVRSFSDVWRDWHEENVMSIAEYTLLITPAALTLAAMIGVLVYFPVVHQHGDLRKSYDRAFRAMGADLGLLVLAVAVLGCRFVFMMNEMESSSYSTDEEGMIYVITFLACGAGWFFWLGRAAMAARGPDICVALPMLCESCGYDLTHQSEQGRCTECGEYVGFSVNSGAKRFGCPWQNKRGFAAWCSTVWTVLTAPKRFYGSFRARAPYADARRYALWHYPVIGVICGLWYLLAIMLNGEHEEDESFLVAAIVGISSALASWGVHRAIVALLFIGALSRKKARELLSLQNVLAYETTYLWVPVIFALVYISCMMVIGDLLENLARAIGLHHVFGIPLPVFIYLGSLFLCLLLWLNRCVIAGREVRWSNY